MSSGRSRERQQGGGRGGDRGENRPPRGGPRGGGGDFRGGRYRSVKRNLYYSVL